MSLSPSGREGLLSSCPTGGGQGRSLMTLMSTGASSSREKRDRQGQRQGQGQREAEVETLKPKARTQDSLERMRVRAEAGVVGNRTFRGLGRTTLTTPGWPRQRVRGSGGEQQDARSCSANLLDPLHLTSYKPPGARETRKDGKEGQGATHTSQHHTQVPSASQNPHPCLPSSFLHSLRQPSFRLSAHVGADVLLKFTPTP